MSGTCDEVLLVTHRPAVWVLEPRCGNQVERIAVEVSEDNGYDLVVDAIVVERYSSLEAAVGMAGYLERDLKRAVHAKALALASVAAISDVRYASAW